MKDIITKLLSYYHTDSIILYYHKLRLIENTKLYKIV